MIVVMFYYPVVEGLEEEFEAAFARRPKLVDHQEGFISFDVLRPTDEDRRFILLSKWESWQTYEAYLRSKEHGHVHKKGNDHARFLAGPTEKRIYEVI